jgi:hypothetical protein
MNLPCAHRLTFGPLQSARALPHTHGAIYPLFPHNELNMLRRHYMHTHGGLQDWGDEE